MMYGHDICEGARTTLSRAQSFASSIRVASIECPEAIERNARFLRDQIYEIQEQLAAVEAKLPGPKEVCDVQRPAA